ncbi:DUF4880 domain-containing protein [Thioclava sp. GXIMD4216]|uniref:FecR family protein n=1 Tax=Thioclava sp. GXIMD4216 TaxID=3131929 RepID=UPI0030D21D23
MTHVMKEENAVKSEALHWFVTLHSKEATEQDRQAAAHWLAKDPAHRAEFEALWDVWRALDDVKDLPAPVFRRPVSASRRAFLSSGLAAGFAAAGLGYVHHRMAAPVLQETGIGEIRSAQLSGGTAVDLDAGTALAAEDHGGGWLRLRQGRARFRVAENASLLHLKAGHVSLQAGAGAYQLHLWKHALAVSVQEGEARLAHPHAGDLKIGRHQQVLLEGHHWGARQQWSPQTGNAWMSGRFIFEDQPLGRVLDDLGRYRHGKVIVMEQALLQLPVSGVFATHRPEDVLAAIEATLPVRRYALTDYLVVLRAA